MEWLKFAFDTLIIGALALPWLWLFMRMFFQRATSKQDDLKFPLLSLLSEQTRQTVAAVLIIALGYFLGSAVSRISSDFFDDEEILQRGMPTQTSIQQGVYLHEYCDTHSVLEATQLPMGLPQLPGGRVAFCEEEKLDLLHSLAHPSSGDPARVPRLVTEFFSLQESKMLLEGEEKLGRLREFHDQIEILRGATLNGAILFTLSWFGLCALYRAGIDNAESDGKILSGKLRAGKLKIPLKFATYVPAVACLLLGLWEMTQHFAHQHELSGTVSVANPAIGKSAPTPNPYEGHRDPPLAEAVMVLLGVGGLCLRISLADDSPRLFRNICLIAAVLTLIGYGSWWWTEVLYDQQVIHSFPTYIQSSL